jgi:serine/threonine protein kinase
VTDAGEQQLLRQQRAHAYDQDTYENHFDLESSLHSLTAQTSPFELQRNIYLAFVSTRHNDVSMAESEFLPNADLCRVINAESVARELAKDLSISHTLEQIQAYADMVCEETEVTRKGKKALRTFRKVFALLVMVEMSSSIPHFLEEDVSDLDLPLIPIKKGGMVELYRRDSADKPSPRPLRCFRHPMWSIAKLRHFEKDQWILLAPYFSPGEHGEVKHYILRDQHVLPFVASEETDEEDAEYFGGFGRVTMVRIHPEHRGFAVKQLYEHDPDSFWKEVHLLKKFSGARGHKHVVSLLATYEHRKKYHFIFYRAEGDLFRLWKGIQRHPVMNYRNVLWVAKQCAGIAGGLMKLHKHLTLTIRHIDSDGNIGPASYEDRPASPITPLAHIRSDSMQANGVRVRPASPPLIPGRSYLPGEGRLKPSGYASGVACVRVEKYGRHGDINPSNILWYSSGPCDKEFLKGTLKIADLGQAELNSWQSKTGPRSVANTMTYRPPECDTQPRIIRQSYDIWCLGCVYLELVAWLLGGEKLLTAFGKARKAPDIFHNNDETDTFFEFVRNPDTSQPEVRIKLAVIKVSNIQHVCSL